MKRHRLPHPQGYYVIGDDHMHSLCRPAGTEIWRFDPGSVLQCEVSLTALEDHSNLLTMAEDERTCMSQGTATKVCMESE